MVSMKSDLKPREQAHHEYYEFTNITRLMSLPVTMHLT